MPKYGSKFEVMEKITDVVKTFGEDGVTIAEISELTGIPYKSITNYRGLFEAYYIREVNHRSIPRRWVYKPPMKKEIFQNAEGYSDPTVGGAIMGTDGMDDFKIGGIYEKRYLILKAFHDALVYLEVCPMETKSEFYTDICVKIEIDGEEYFVNPHRVWSTLPYKVNKTGCIKPDFNVFRKIASLCGMNVVEVEKEVEKTVYQDKIIEKRVEDDEYKELKHENEMLSQKAEIWEKAFMAVTRGGVA